MIAHFSSETMMAIEKWHNVLCLKEKNCQPSILYAMKMSFSNEEEFEHS